MQYSIIYKHSTVQHVFRMYSPCVTTILYLLIRNSFFFCSPPKHLAVNILSFAFLSLTILDCLFKWKHAVFVLLWLGYWICIMSSEFIHVVAYGILFFFNAELCSIVCTYHIFCSFIHQWTFKLFLHLRYYEGSSNEHWSANIASGS